MCCLFPNIFLIMTLIYYLYFKLERTILFIDISVSSFLVNSIICFPFLFLTYNSFFNLKFIIMHLWWLHVRWMKYYITPTLRSKWYKSLFHNRRLFPHFLNHLSIKCQSLAGPDSVLFPIRFGGCKYGLRTA